MLDFLKDNNLMLSQMSDREEDEDNKNKLTRFRTSSK